MAYSSSQVITWAKTSQVLAYFDSEKKSNIQGGYIDKDLHMKIWVEWQSLAWEYAQDPSSENLYEMNNYVFSLCFPYIFEAMTISGASGASSTPTVPGSSYIYNEIKVTVGAAGAPVAGGTTYTNTDLIGGTDLSFMFIDKLCLFVGDDFSFDSSTGTITLLLSNVWIPSSVLVIPYNQLV